MEGLSAARLRAVLIEAGIEMAPLVEGVRQDTMENLERTLGALEREYEAGDRARKQQVRRVVIVARQHAEWASRSSRAGPEQKRMKQEMQLWIRTWLENPTLFADWARLRKREEACEEGRDEV